MLQDLYDDTKNKMAKAITVLKKDFSQLRTGRASASMLDSILVDCYGSKTPITQLANVSLPEPRQLVIKPWDASIMDSISKAILVSDIGITPVIDKNVIRLNVPQLTEETRKKIVKLAKTKSEDCKVAVRNNRRDANKRSEELKKGGKITEDDMKKSEKIIQDITDTNIKEIDDLYLKKEKEILEV